MKNRQIFWGFLLIVAGGLFMLGITGCDNETTGLNPGPEIVSEWECTYTDEEIGEITLTLVLFTDNTCKSIYHTSSKDEADTGAYSISGNTITITLGDETKTGTISDIALNYGDRIYQKLL
jgi:hypothetical protein